MYKTVIFFDTLLAKVWDQKD